MSKLKKIKYIVAQTAFAILKAFFPIKKGCVLCESFGGLQYSCNPKYITEAILKYYPTDFQIVWVFRNPDSVLDLDKRIIKVKKWSFKEFFYIATSEFFVSNIRLNDRNWGWKKRTGQKYIMTWHGSMALKRVEFDAKDRLSSVYLDKAKNDSMSIDLMLSDSEWCTSFLKSAFHYEGQILNKGLPRNDVFLNSDTIGKMREKVRSFYGIEDEEKILLYAPTFRVNKSIEYYIFCWDDILKAAEKRWNSKFKILIRLHPSMIGTVDTTPMMTLNCCVDVTDYSDMQELLCASDVLITDYSSSMFEFAIKRSPCFLYTPDSESYDRGFYFKLDELPFPISSDLEALEKHISSFDVIKYAEDLHFLYNDIFKYTQESNSSLLVVEWMKKKKNFKTRI